MPPHDPDPYATLGVARDATVLEIARAHRRLAKLHHPDVSAHPTAAARMRDLNEAWHILSNARRRTAWDLAHPAPGVDWRLAAAPGVRRTSAAPVDRGGGKGGWVALVVASLLLVGMLAAGVAAAMGQPAGPGDVTPGYHGNLD
jgi:hypothetical protein